MILSKGQHGAPVWKTAVCVIVAEVVVVIAAWAVRKVDSLGRKPLFLAAFALLALGNGLTNVSRAGVLHFLAEPGRCSGHLWCSVDLGGARN